MKKVTILFLFSYFALLTQLSFAKDKLTVLYTGQTHASLYPCDCPVEPEGGVVRRATQIDQIRKTEHNLIVLDSGGFFAGGILDTNSQDAKLDKARTKVNLAAMDLMGYDAVAVGNEEFNFGTEFLKEVVAKSKMKFLSCNLKLNKVLPFIIKEFNGIEVGIIGLSPADIKNKHGLNIIETKAALTKVINQLRNKGIDLIIVLSYLGEEEDLKLVFQVQGIDFIISGNHLPTTVMPYKKINATLILYPTWEGKALGRLDIILEQGKIIEAIVQGVGLSGQIQDSPKLLSILPECFSDKDCRGTPSQPGLVNKCINPGTKDAKCSFDKPVAKP